ncbi:hypothetical protein [Brevundimonas fluminis]|uniref:hypothetical protein n=1 Tax=Brevundimonas fluminis TaxID=2487274 RepID=UPI000F657682|nr:hypothetical protein [Brevundimonas fluminis]
MPHPRPPRAPRVAEDDDPAEHARLMHELRTRVRAIDWLLECRREMWRRVRLDSPPNGPWVAAPGLVDRISRERVAAGEAPPPGLPPEMYPPGWTAPTPRPHL